MLLAAMEPLTGELNSHLAAFFKLIICVQQRYRTAGGAVAAVLRGQHS